MNRHQFYSAPEGKDQEIWYQAQLRARFKTSLAMYLAVNALLVGIWAATSYQHDFRTHFWPIWPILGWGIGLFFQYLHAYRRSNFFSVEQEYEKLKNRQEKSF